MIKFTARTDAAYVPALAATGVWLGVGAALDVYLVATHKERVITDVLRTKPGKTLLIVLCLHVVNTLGPADPFRFVAGIIANKFPRIELSDLLPDQ